MGTLAGLTNLSSTTDAQTLQDTFTPTQICPIILCILSTGAGVQPTITDTQNLGWDFVCTQTDGTVRLDVFASQQMAATSADTVTVDFGAGHTFTTCFINPIQCASFSKLGAAVIKQFKVNSGAAASTPGVTFDAACLTANGTLFFAGNRTSPAGITVVSGMTNVVDAGRPTPTTGCHLDRRNTGFTGTALTAGSTSATAWVAIGLEVDAANNPKSDTDTTTGTDATTGIGLSSTDSSSGSENAGSLAAQESASDLASASATETLAAALAASDGLTGGATEVVQITKTSTDSSTGTSSESYTYPLSSADSATGSELTPNIITLLVGTDLAAFVEAGLLTVTITSQDALDGSGVESYSALIQSTDTLAGLETSEQVFGPVFIQDTDFLTLVSELASVTLPGLAVGHLVTRSRASGNLIKRTTGVTIAKSN